MRLLVAGIWPYLAVAFVSLAIRSSSSTLALPSVSYHICGRHNSLAPMSHLWRGVHPKAGGHVQRVVAASVVLELVRVPFRALWQMV